MALATSSTGSPSRLRTVTSAICAPAWLDGARSSVRSRSGFARRQRRRSRSGSPAASASSSRTQTRSRPPAPASMTQAFQQARSSRPILKPSRLPSTVSAICFGSKNCGAIRCTSSAGHGFDAVDQLVQAEEAAEVHFLPRQVRHAAGGRFQAEHQRALQVVLGAPQFFVGHRFLLELAEFLQDRRPPPCAPTRATCRRRPTGSRCRGTGSARKTPRRPAPAARGCSGTAASSCRRRAACSARSRRSAPRAAADRTARPGTDAPVRATSCCAAQCAHAWSARGSAGGAAASAAARRSAPAPG